MCTDNGSVNFESKSANASGPRVEVAVAGGVLLTLVKMSSILTRTPVRADQADLL